MYVVYIIIFVVLICLSTGHGIGVPIQQEMEPILSLKTCFFGCYSQTF
jgi:hypothetical protein